MSALLAGVCVLLSVAMVPAAVMLVRREALPASVLYGAAAAAVCAFHLGLSFLSLGPKLWSVDVLLMSALAHLALASFFLARSLQSARIR